jgi:phage terminase large subunit
LNIQIALQPKQQQFARSIETTPVTFFGGAKGGGKSAGLRKIFLARRFKYPGSVGAIFRKTYPELEANHIRPIFEEYPLLRQYYNESKKVLSLPNGSSLQFCHASSEKDLDLYQGREFNDLGIEEAGQWTEVMFRRLMGSNRSSKPGIPARCALTGNPGGIGHKWLKRLFIERRFNERENPKDYAFIQALVRDNQALLLNDPDYVRRLEAEPSETLRKAYLYGDWDIFAGQFFSEIRREIHFITPFAIPVHWNRFGAYDFGFNHPAAFGWFAVDEDGNVYLYRELIKAKLRVDQFASALNQYEETKDIPIYAGWDCWVQKGVLKEGTPPTVADEFSSHGLFLKKAVIDRIQGAAQLRKYLAWQNLSDGRDKPRFFIFNTCPISFDCLTRVEHDPDRIEDVLKIDAVDGDPMSGDDAYDMIRMGLMSRPAITDPIIKRHPLGSPGWYKEQTDGIWEREREKLQENENNWPSDHDNSWPDIL